MTLLELHADVGRVADALEKLVFLLEKLVFPPPRDVKVQQATLDDLRFTTPDDVARMQTEQAEFAERYNVVPGSDAFDLAILMDWEQQQKGIHGQGWKPPEDWRKIMAQAQRQEGESRTEADAATQTADRI